MGEIGLCRSYQDYVRVGERLTRRWRCAREAFGVRREKLLERLLLLARVRNEQGPRIEIGVADRNPRPVDAQRQSGNKARGQKRTERPAFRLLGIDIGVAPR